ncbi:hypothetical protein ADL07_07975 [Streptomyces sp. NRRL F-4707]|nr:hypothetical protein ADL07_07975 [Streptomyces sp. NRRL F-4707]
MTTSPRTMMMMMNSPKRSAMVSVTTSYEGVLRQPKPVTAARTSSSSRARATGHMVNHVR